jgi:hypothetical protein
MGRWQDKIIKHLLPSPQNHQKPVSLSFGGFGGLTLVRLENQLANKVSVDSDKAEGECRKFIDSEGLPLCHCRENLNGDSNWIRHRLKRVAVHKRSKLAAEYALRYISVFNQENNETRKENKARKNANLWLLRLTSHAYLNENIVAKAITSKAEMKLIKKRKKHARTNHQE